MAEEQQQPGPPPEERATGLSFDKAAAHHMSRAAAEVIAVHPEIRSVIVTFDYRGGLNDANIEKAVWIAEGGPVTQLDEMFGSAGCLLRVLNHIGVTIESKMSKLSEEAQVIGTELVRRRTELNAAAATPESPTPTEPADHLRVRIQGWPDVIWRNAQGTVFRVGGDKVLADYVSENFIKRHGFSRGGSVVEGSNQWIVWSRPESKTSGGEGTAAQ